MTEAQLKNLSDDELLRVVENAWRPPHIVLELARRLKIRREVEERGECPYCGEEF